MIHEGADLIDVGARSTWPLSAKNIKEQERSRLIPAIKALADIPVPVLRGYYVFPTLQKKHLLPEQRS